MIKVKRLDFKDRQNVVNAIHFGYVNASFVLVMSLYSIPGLIAVSVSENNLETLHDK